MKRLFFIAITCLLFSPTMSRGDEIYLKCIGKYELGRGKLIQPDWDETFLTINLNGLTSTIDDGGTIKKGRTAIKGNFYNITHYKNYKINIKYKVSTDYKSFIVNYPQSNITILGQCSERFGKG